MRFHRLPLIVSSLVVALGVGGVLRIQAAVGTTITLLCSNGFKAVAEDLVPKFERATRNKVVVKYDLAANLKQKIEAGEPFDIAVVTPAAMDDLIAHGKIAGGTRMTIARSGLAIAIRAGAPKTDISTVDALKRALLEAKGIAYAKEGASGRRSSRASLNSASCRSARSSRSKARSCSGRFPPRFKATS